MRRRIASRLSAALIILMATGGVLMGVVITQTGTSLLMEASTARLGQESKDVSIRLQDIFDAVQRDMAFLARSPSVRQVVSVSADGADLSVTASVREQARRQLQEVFTALLNNHPWYVQARLIGLEEEGKEIVRVDQVEGQIRRVPDDELQRKGHREYFRETLGRVAGELYWSPINLNREHGRIVEPYQPVLRVGMPVTDVDGKLFGIIILNVDIRRVFDAARDVVSPGVTLYIANREGDYLYHPDSEKTFGFDLGQRHRVQDDFTEAASLLESVRADIMKDILVPPGPEQVVAHLSLLPLRQDSDNTLLLGLTTPSEVVVGEVNAARRKAAVLILPFLLVGAVVVIWLVRIFIGPLERVTREVSRFAPGVHRQQLPEENRHDEVGLLAQAFSRMAHRIEHQVDELEDEKRRFQSLFETAPDAIIIIDQDGTVEYINGATERLFGYSARELVGRDVNRLMPEPDKGRHGEYMERYLEGGEPHIIGIGRQVTGMHKDGHAIALYLSIGEFTLGGRRKFTGILHDISS